MQKVFANNGNSYPIPTGWDDLKNGLRPVILDVNLYNYTTSLLIKTFWDVGNYCFH